MLEEWLSKLQALFITSKKEFLLLGKSRSSLKEDVKALIKFLKRQHRVIQSKTQDDKSKTQLNFHPQQICQDLKQDSL
jgi:hypothetical protein